jgi:hypothetical protein
MALSRWSTKPKCSCLRSCEGLRADVLLDSLLGLVSPCRRRDTSGLSTPQTRRRTGDQVFKDLSTVGALIAARVWYRSCIAEPRTNGMDQTAPRDTRGTRNVSEEWRQVAGPGQPEARGAAAGEDSHDAGGWADWPGAASALQAPTGESLISRRPDLPPSPRLRRTAGAPAEAVRSGGSCAAQGRAGLPRRIPSCMRSPVKS